MAIRIKRDRNGNKKSSKSNKVSGGKVREWVETEKKEKERIENEPAKVFLA